jgi:3-oxoacyl-[acyl-carrier protein] reductase
MDLQLKGLKAIVTGGTKGIGLAIARTLAQEGADVAICARDEAAVTATAGALAELGGARASGAAVDGAGSIS